MTTILAIDPGPTESAWLEYSSEDQTVREFAKVANTTLLSMIRHTRGDTMYAVVIEQVQSYGMAVGAEVFETVYWSGRFAEAAQPLRVERIGRKRIVTELCGSARAKDSNVRQALIDRFGGSAAIGRKAAPGPLYGVSKDVWSALALAVVWSDLEGAKR